MPVTKSLCSMSYQLDLKVMLACDQREADLNTISRSGIAKVM